MPRSLLSPKISVRMSATLRNLLVDSSKASVNHPNLNYAPPPGNGVDANQASRGWQSVGRVLFAGAAESLDLSDFAAVDIGAGAGMDGVGQAVDYEEVVAIAVVNENAVDAAGQLEIEGPAIANGFDPIGDHTVALDGALLGQGFLMKVQVAAVGFNIDPAGNRFIEFTANGGPVTYSIYLLTRHEDVEMSSSSSSVSSISTSSVSSSSSSRSSSSVSSSSWSSTSTSSSQSTSSSSSSSSSSASSSSWSSQS